MFGRDKAAEATVEDATVVDPEHAGADDDSLRRAPDFGPVAHCAPDVDALEQHLNADEEDVVVVRVDLP